MDGTAITLALLTSGFLTAMWLLKRDAYKKRSNAYRSGGSRYGSTSSSDGTTFDVGEMFGGGSHHHHHHDGTGCWSWGSDSNSSDCGGDCGGGDGGGGGGD